MFERRFGWLLMRGGFAVIASMLWLGIAWPASADAILYSFDGVGVGTLDGAAFDGDFEIRVAADTADIDVFLAAISTLYFVDGSGTIELPTGPGSFTNPVRVISNQPQPMTLVPSIGIGILGDLFAFEDPAADGYLLDRAFGPLVGNSPLLRLVDIPLDIGVLRFTEIRQVTFRATLIPEPSTALLIGMGLLAALRMRGCR